MTSARKKASETMEFIDVVIEVLDARAPEASCNPMIRELREHRQRPCLKILNKVDLADPVVTQAWLNYYNKQQGVKAVALSCKSASDAAKVPKLFQPLAPHCWGPRPAELIQKMTAHIEKTAPKGADLRSWRY